MFVRLCCVIVILYFSSVDSRITTSSDGSLNIVAPTGSVTLNGDFSINNRSVLQYIQTAKESLIAAEHLNLRYLSTLRYQAVAENATSALLLSAQTPFLATVTTSLTINLYDISTQKFTTNYSMGPVTAFHGYYYGGNPYIIVSNNTGITIFPITSTGVGTHTFITGLSGYFGYSSVAISDKTYLSALDSGTVYAFDVAQTSINARFFTPKTATTTKMGNVNGMPTVAAIASSAVDIYVNTSVAGLKTITTTSATDIEFFSAVDYYVVIGQQKAYPAGSVSEIYKYSGSFNWDLDSTIPTPNGVLDLEIFDFQGEKYLAVVEPSIVSVYRWNRAVQRFYLYTTVNVAAKGVKSGTMTDGASYLYIYNNNSVNYMYKLNLNL